MAAADAGHCGSLLLTERHRALAICHEGTLGDEAAARANRASWDEVNARAAVFDRMTPDEAGASYKAICNMRRAVHTGNLTPAQFAKCQKMVDVNVHKRYRIMDEFVEMTIDEQRACMDLLLPFLFFNATAASVMYALGNIAMCSDIAAAEVFALEGLLPRLVTLVPVSAHTSVGLFISILAAASPERAAAIVSTDGMVEALEEQVPRHCFMVLALAALAGAGQGAALVRAFALNKTVHSCESEALRSSMAKYAPLPPKCCSYYSIEGPHELASIGAADALRAFNASVGGNKNDLEVRAARMTGPFWSYGDTPAHIAARRGHVEVLKVLADLGVDLTIKDSKGQDLITVARDDATRSVIRSLLAPGA